MSRCQLTIISQGHRQSFLIRIGLIRSSARPRLRPRKTIHTHVCVAGRLVLTPTKDLHLRWQSVIRRSPGVYWYHLLGPLWDVGRPWQHVDILRLLVTHLAEPPLVLSLLSQHGTLPNRLFQSPRPSWGIPPDPPSGLPEMAVRPLQ